MLQLKPHQQAVVDENKAKQGIFFDKGVGKTAICLHLAKGNTIVVCKKSEAVNRTWENEREKFVITTPITVFSREMFKKVYKTLPPCNTLIIDEADTMLNGSVTFYRGISKIKKTDICKALFDYTERVQPERIYPATATILRTPVVLYHAGKLLGKEWKEDKFLNAFYYAQNNRLKIKKGIDKLMIDTVKSIGYTGTHSNHTYVPDQIIRPIFVPLTEEQKERVIQVQLEYPDERVALQKIYQIHNGVLKGNQFAESEKIPNHKSKELLSIAKRHPQMIIFVQFSEQIDDIVSALKNYNVHTLTGKTKNSKEVLNTVSNSTNYILIAQSTISAGWELPYCDTTVFASGWACDDTIQGEGRVQRAHNLKTNTYYYIMTDTQIDRALYKKLEAKKKLYNKLNTQ